VQSPTQSSSSFSLPDFYKSAKYQIAISKRSSHSEVYYWAMLISRAPHLVELVLVPDVIPDDRDGT
jgi:hypothetical protein